MNIPVPGYARGQALYTSNRKGLSIFFTGKRIVSLVKSDWFVFQTINDSISYQAGSVTNYILPGMPYQAGPAVAVDKLKY